MPFPALSTENFNKYERKCKWLEYIILPISSVVVKVQCLREKGKTVMPSRKLQAKGRERETRLRLSSSLVIRWLRARRLQWFTLQTGKRHQYNAKNF